MMILQMLGTSEVMPSPNLKSGTWQSLRYPKVDDEQIHYPKISPCYWYPVNNFSLKQ